MPGPIMADVDQLLRDILTTALPEEVTVVEYLPADWTDLYPIVVARKLPGGAAVAMGLLERALCQVDVYDDDKTDALNLAQSCRTALYEAWRTQMPYRHGSISDYSETAAPAVLPKPNQPAGETFVPATYQLHVCP